MTEFILSAPTIQLKGFEAFFLWNAADHNTYNIAIAEYHGYEVNTEDVRIELLAAWCYSNSAVSNRIMQCVNRAVFGDFLLKVNPNPFLDFICHIHNYNPTRNE
jgi:hypothetical protein